MCWECAEVDLFWKEVSSALSTLLDVHIACCPRLLILNETSSLKIPRSNLPFVFAGCTAAKKLLSVRWKPPRSLPQTLGLLTFVDAVLMEQTIAKIHCASERAVLSWDLVATDIKQLLL